MSNISIHTNLHLLVLPSIPLPHHARGRLCHCRLCSASAASMQSDESTPSRSIARSRGVDAYGSTLLVWLMLTFFHALDVHGRIGPPAPPELRHPPVPAQPRPPSIDHTLTNDDPNEEHTRAHTTDRTTNRIHTWRLVSHSLHPNTSQSVSRSTTRRRDEGRGARPVNYLTDTRDRSVGIYSWNFMSWVHAPRGVMTDYCTGQTS